MAMLCCTGSPHSPVKVGLVTVVVASRNSGLFAWQQRRPNDYFVHICNVSIMLDRSSDPAHLHNVVGGQ